MNASLLPQAARFHHVGLATTDLQRERTTLELLGYTPFGDPFEDPVQGVAGCFLDGPGPRMELLAALPGHDVLEPWLRGGSRLYHLAYEVPELDATLAAAVDAGARAVSPPVPAVAFGQRRVTFLMLPTRLLVEFIELV